MESLFAGFNPSLLDDNEFKEDSVREVIITPILNRLGYSPSGPNCVIRSKSLVHPFIYAGTRKVPITLIPDYTLISDDSTALILDAKHPNEDVLSRANVQQAYSYAIHPEIKCQHFALCNGKALAVFNVDKNEPLLHLIFSEFESKWDEIEKHISPKNLKYPMLKRFAPDFGCALARFGLVEGGIISLLPAQLNLFMRLDDNMMTAMANTEFADKPHCVSFDFNRKLLPEILAGLPAPLANAFSHALSRAPFRAAAELAIEVDIDTRLGPEIETELENYRPLIIERVLAARFNPVPLPTAATDIPKDVFRLREHYSIKPPPKNT
jgi:hypothetical protein